jgi:hypothetical protein
MIRPYTVTVELFRGAAIAPFNRLSHRVLAPSVLEACSLAERDLNVALDDVEYAAAVEARQIWEPRPAVSSMAMAHAA